ncbi:MAG: hypothetical protein DRJ31_09440 [Candidatus Methanomethylicota archaeon]|uniref:Uncharacterized protein n=1 Tax=Thermoproteota archaeon TaxID=2056631 RepID=A0A497EKH9_9CREN|nr:MAG: hypothetical protein DRJ31_09440 [Candidatus Verstraetearchaeota archaeon]
MLFWALRDVTKGIDDLPEFHGFIDLIAKVELLAKTETLQQVLYLIRLVKNTENGLERLEYAISDLLTEYQSEIDYLNLIEPIFHYVYEKLEKVVKEESGKESKQENKLPQVIKNSH